MLRYSTSDGWKDADLVPLSIDHSVDAYGQRITHYVKWCLEAQRPFRYEQIIFSPDESEKVYLRHVAITVLSRSTLSLTIQPRVVYAYQLLAGSGGTTLMNSISDAVLITEAEPFDLPGPRILFANDAFEKMTGYSRSEVLGSSPRLLQCEATDPKARSKIRETLEKWTPFREEVLNQRKDGSRFVVELSISPVKDETGWWTHWISVQRDISKQREVDDFIRRSRLVIEKVGIGTWNLDLVNNELSWDEQMYSLYEIDPNNFSGDYEAWQGSLHPDDFEQCVKAVDDAVNGIKNFDIEFRILTGTNTIKYIHAKAEVLRDSKGLPLAMLGVNWEITDRILHEQESSKQQQISIHKSKLASIGEIAAGVGHEINNPLTVIMGNVENMLPLAAKNPSDKTLIQGLERILLSAERIENIVKGLRMYARSDERIDTFCLAETAVESTLLLQDIYAAEGVKLSLSTNFDSDYYVSGNKGKVQQVIMNLLSNAKDAIESAEAPFIFMDIYQDAISVTLSIQDNGIGISESHQSSIFESFFTTKEQGKGTGIGLSISESIIVEHDGELKFESVENQGSTFLMILPLAKNLPHDEFLDTEPDIVQPPKIKVLLVDDNQEVLELLAGILSRNGLEVYPYNSALEALEAYTSLGGDIDLVVSDMQMPEMDGVSFLVEVQKSHPLSKPKMVIVTGGVTLGHSDLQAVHPDLIDGLIYKPFRSKEVLSLVESLFE